MKKILLILGCLMVMLGGYAAEKSQTVVFTTSTSVDGTALSATTSFSTFIDSGAEFFEGISSNVTQVYYKSTNGLKFSSSKNNGSVTFTLAAPVNMTKVVVNAAKYKTDAGSLAVGDLNAQSMSSTDLADYTFNVTGEQSSITLNATKRLYVKSITFYYESDEASTPNFSGFDEEYTLVLEDTMPLPAITPKELTYHFESSDENIVKVVEDNLVATGVGEATITFTTEAVEGAFLEGEGSFKVNVVKKTPKMWFPDQSVYGKLGVGVKWQSVMIEGPENVNSESTSVTYTSSDENIVVVHPNTGRIIANPLPGEETTEQEEPGVKAAGKVIITATYEGDAEYAEHSATYEIIIIDPEDTNVPPATDIFDFSVKDAYGLKTFSSGSDYETNVNEISEKIVSIKFSGEVYRLWEKTSGNTTSYEFRIGNAKSNENNNDYFTISVPDNYKITKIGLIGATLKGSYSPTSATVGSNENDGDDDWSNVSYKNTWLPSGTEPVHEVAWSVTARNDISQIYVQYELINSNLKTPSLSFDQHVYAIYAGKPAKVNLVNNPEGVEVEYDLPTKNLEKDVDYFLTPKDDYLEVIVNTPGYYTLQATSPADDNYRDGFAILRLNVYRPLNVDVDGKELSTDAEGQEMISTAKDVTVNIENLDLVNLYYQIVKDGEPVKPSEDPDAAEDEDRMPGYTMVDTDDFSGIDDETNDYYITIPQYTEGELWFYIANYGYISPIRKIKLVAPADLEGIALEVDESVKYNVEEQITIPIRNLNDDINELPGTITYTVYKRSEDGDTYEEVDTYTEPENPGNEITMAFTEAGIYTLEVKWTGDEYYKGNKITSAGITVYAAANLSQNEKGVKFLGSEFEFKNNIQTDNGTIPAALVFAEGSKDNSIRLDMSDFDELHYSVFEYVHDAKNAPAFYAPRKAGEEEPAEGETETTEPEFTKHDGVSAITLPGEHGRIYIKTVKNGVESPVEDALYTNDASLLDDIQTGVAVIEANEGTAVYFDLNGVRVNGSELKAGVYVRVADGKAAKVMVK